MFSFKNIKKDWISTVVGLVIIASAVRASIVYDFNEVWPQCSGAMVLGALFMGLDFRNMKGGGLTVFTILAICAIVFNACKTPIKSVEHTREVKVRDTTIYIKGDTVKIGLDNTDAIKAVLLAMEARGEPPEIKVLSRDTRTEAANARGWAQLKFTLDSLKRLQVECDCKDSLYTLKIREYFDKQTKTTIVSVDKIPPWVIAVMLFLCCTIILLLIKNFRK